MDTAYLALDVHASTTTFGWMDEDGEYQTERRFDTSAGQLLRHVGQVEVEETKLVLEEGPLAGWVARTLWEEVDEVIVCDPRENDSISNAIHKNDSADTYELCRLLRLGAVQEVYHPADDERALFKSAARHYCDLRDQVKKAKQKIAANYLQRGIFKTQNISRYSEAGRSHYLDQIEKEPVVRQQRRLYEMLDTFKEAKAGARTDLLELGRSYSEIREFQKIPGIGPIRSHLFDAFIQTPRRFPGQSELYRYCQLGVKKQSTGGQKSGPEGLDIRGVGELKNISRSAWETATGDRTGPNEVQTYYEHSLERSNNPVNARLNTQRKILKTMWGLWKSQSAYDRELFLGSDPACG